MMKPSVKSMFVIILTLVIGIAIGFEVSEILLKKRFEMIRSVREPNGFINHFNDVIKPTDEQKATVDSIILKYHVKMEKISISTLPLISAQIDSMALELKTVLNDEQMKRFKEEFNRMKKFPPGHPPDGARPPEGMRPPDGNHPHDEQGMPAGKKP
jgi:hypothetical protein